MEERGRNPIIDSARGCAMFLVLFGHALEMSFWRLPNHTLDPIAFLSWKVIYSFHIPAFYFVSGMATKSLRNHSLSKVLVTAFALVFFADVTHILAFPLSVLDSHLRGGQVRFIRDGILPVFSGYNYCLIRTWFLFSLAVVVFLAWIYRRGGMATKVAIWCVTAAAFLINRESGLKVFECQSWAFGLIFFLLGREIIRFDERAAGIKPWRFCFPFLAALTLLLLSFPFNQRQKFGFSWPGIGETGPGFGVRMATGDLGYIPFFMLTAICGIATIVFFALMLRETALSRALSWIGRNTISLLVLNGLFLTIVQPHLAAAISLSQSRFSSLGWAFLFSVVQIACLPVVRPLLMRIYSFCRTVATSLVDILPVNSHGEKRSLQI